MNRYAIVAACGLCFFTGAAHGSEPVTGPSLGGRWVIVNPKAGESTDYFGAQLRLQGRVLGLEGSIDRLNRSAGGTTVIDYPFMLTLMARLAPEFPVTPFLLAGMAWYSTSIETTNPFTGEKRQHSDERLGYHAGFGLQVYADRSLSIDATWRHVWVEAVSSRDSSAQNKRWDSTGDMFTLGLNIGF